MSTLKTNAIQTVAGKPILHSTGSILQVVNANTVGQSGEIITSSSTFVTTGLSVSITPLSASSKLFVQWTGNCKFYIAANVGDDGMKMKIYRDGTAINSGAADNLFYRSDNNGSSMHSNQTISHYVNANSTTSTTFTLYFANEWGGNAVIGRDWGTCQFTVWEISA